MAKAKNITSGSTPSGTKSGATNVPANRPVGIQKKMVSGGGNVYKRGDGIGGGPVGGVNSFGGIAKPAQSGGYSPPPVSSGRYVAPSTPSAPPAPSSGGGQQAGIRTIGPRLAELMQQQAQLEAERREKQAALTSAQENAATLQRDRIQERQLAMLNDAMQDLQKNMARNAAQKSNAANAAYHAIPVQRPLLTVSPQDNDGVGRANIRNLTDDHKTLMGLIEILPDNFPIDRFDDMTPKQQLAAVGRTDLSREEQWALLNARKNLKPLAQIMDIQENRLRYGLTQAQADELCRQLIEIDDMRIGVNNREIPFNTGLQRSVFLKDLENRERIILESIGYGQNDKNKYNSARREIPANSDKAPGDDSGWMERYTYIREHYGFEPNPRALINDRNYKELLTDCENAEALTNFQKTFVAKARSGIPIDQVPEVVDLFKNGGTFTVGLSAQAGAGAAINGSIGYTVDANGQQWHPSFSVGASSPDVSAGIFFMYTNAPDAETVGRSTVITTGGAIGPFGMDYVTIIDTDYGAVYSGIMYSESVSSRLIQLPPLSYHSLASLPFLRSED